MTLMLVVATFVLFHSIVLKMHSVKNPVPHVWIQKVVSYFEQNRVLKYLVYSPFDEVNNSVEEEQTEISKNQKIWTLFFRAIDRFIIIILMISYKFYKGY
jgi:hypothetical protein